MFNQSTFLLLITLNHFSGNKWISRLKNNRCDKIIDSFSYFNLIRTGAVILHWSK